MKANELRIGNLFRYKDEPRVKTERRGNVYQIIPDDIVFISEHDPDYIEPIPITEEWLLKLGFDKFSDRVFILDSFGYEFGHTCRALLKNEDCVVLFPLIKHVHQLQNLYFALTGEELKYETNH